MDRESYAEYVKVGPPHSTHSVSVVEWRAELTNWSDGSMVPLQRAACIMMAMSSAARHTVKPFTYLWLWLLILGVLTGMGVLWLWATAVDPMEEFSPAIILIAYSASLAAILAASLSGGWRVVWELLRQIGRWRFAVRWYMVALFLPVGVVGTAYALYWLAGGRIEGSILDVSALAVGLGAIIAGSLGEEIGWRGFAQPILQQKLNIFWASVVVGVIWATWHCWTVIAPGGLDGYWFVDVVLTYIRLIATAVLYGWLYNVTGRSLFAVMLAHAAHNIVLTCLPVNNIYLTALIAVLYAVVALIVSWFARRELFSSPAKIS